MAASPILAPMSTAGLLRLLLLSAIWGASFLLIARLLAAARA